MSAALRAERQNIALDVRDVSHGYARHGQDLPVWTGSTCVWNPAGSSATLRRGRCREPALQEDGVPIAGPDPGEFWGSKTRRCSLAKREGNLALGRGARGVWRESGPAG